MLFTHLLLPDKTSVQPTFLKYSVMHSNKTIGSMTMENKRSGNVTNITSLIDVKKRLLLLFRINEVHKQIFVNGVMVNSWVRRTINGTTRVKRQTILADSTYSCTDEEKKKQSPIRLITNSVLAIHFSEPIGVEEVFSDNFQQMVKIHPRGDHVYEILMPDGDKNVFYYTNGICTKVIAYHDLYTLEFILTDFGSQHL